MSDLPPKPKLQEPSRAEKLKAHRLNLVFTYHHREILESKNDTETLNSLNVARRK